MDSEQWIVYIFSRPSRDALVLASRFGSIWEAIARGKEYERKGFYYSLELVRPEPQVVNATSTGTEG